MPLFEYECADCQKTQEVLVRSQQEAVVCPQCGGARLTKLISAPAAPSMGGEGGSLPVTGGGESCGAPRCCGGVCNEF
jgi:putative FmdB family regulatory protein